MKSSPFYALFFVIVIVVLCQACTGGAIEFAEESLNSGNVADLKKAGRKLLGYIGRNPESTKGHETIARVYMKLRHDLEAKAHFREMILNGGSPVVVVAEYQKLIANLVNTTKPNYDKAFKIIGDIASILRDKHPNHATSEYIKLGNHAAKNNYPGMAAKCFGKAEKSKPTEDQRQKIGNGYLWLASNGFQTERMKTLATPLVGEEKIKQVWPGEQTQVVFEGVYDDSHIMANGNINVVLKGRIQKGDILEVKAKIEGKKQYDAEEISIWKGKYFKPKWDISKNGKFSKKIEINGTDIIQSIWIEKGKNIKAHLRVLRKYTPKPNLSSISISN